jgi:outer membrane lipoprotein-sorting protein
MKKAAVIIFALLLCVSTAYPITIETIVNEMNARHQKILEKAGGIKIVQNIKSFSEGVEVSSTQTILKKGTLYRIETITSLDLEEDKTKNVILFDGSNVWFISPFVGITIMPKDESLINGVFDDFSKLIPEESKLVGEEKVNKEECYIIEIPEEAEVPFYKIWVSKTHFVPIKARGKLGEKIVSLLFMKYKKVKGIWGIPYKTKTYINGKHVSSVTVDKVETGITIVDETFEVRP